MHISHLDEAFHKKNYFLNRCDNTGRTQCMVGVENESKHDPSVAHNQQFVFFLPSDTLQVYTGDLVYYETIPDII